MFQEPLPKRVCFQERLFAQPWSEVLPPHNPLVRHSVSTASKKSLKNAEDYLLRIRDVAGIGQDKGAEFVEILHGPAPLVTWRVLLLAGEKTGCL